MLIAKIFSLHIVLIATYSDQKNTTAPNYHHSVKTRHPPSHIWPYCLPDKIGEIGSLPCHIVSMRREKCTFYFPILFSCVPCAGFETKIILTQICIAFTKNKRNYDGQYSCYQKNPENILYPLMLYIILSYIFHPKFSSSSYSRYSLYHLSLFCTIILSPNGRGLTPFRFNVTIYRYIICRYIKLLSYTNQRRPE